MKLTIKGKIVNRKRHTDDTSKYFKITIIDVLQQNWKGRRKGMERERRSTGIQLELLE